MKGLSVHIDHLYPLPKHGMVVLPLPPHRDSAPTSQNVAGLASLTWRMPSRGPSMHRYNADQKGLFKSSRIWSMT